MTEIERVDSNKAAKYIEALDLSPEEKAAMDHCLMLSAFMWVGLIDGGLACIWGLIPPTLMSNQAYLWLYTTDLIKGHEFILIRHSQLVMEEMLEQFPSICGHAIVGNDKAIRWLKWLGARFGEPDGLAVPFRITKHG